MTDKPLPDALRPPNHPDVIENTLTFAMVHLHRALNDGPVTLTPADVEAYEREPRNSQLQFGVAENGVDITLTRRRIES